MSSPAQDLYIPPHLRHRPASSPDTPPGRIISGGGFDRHSAPSRSGSSRTPWSSPSAQGSASSPADPSRYSLLRNSQSTPNRRPADLRRGGAPTLFVFGDSFVGPMKLLSEDCVRVTTFKGASAKGLNNPNSIKQVSRDLLPAVNSLLAPPPYVYMPSAGRWALFVFGNVDLQINYLWQLQHKRISPQSFATSPTPEAAGEDAETGSSVLASATETSLRGPALGPDLFVATILSAYTTFLQREIVNGPVGQRLRESAEARRAAENGGTPPRRKIPPSKVLIAGALPPLVEDDVLPRIPEKYVERMEGEHEKAHRAIRTGSGSRAPWTQSQDTAGIEVGLATISLSDRPATPNSSSSSSDSSLFESLGTSTQSAFTEPSPKNSKTSFKPSTTPLVDLLQHDPPLCTLPVRVRMTELFNTGLKAFCDSHPDVLGFIDITFRMLSHDAESGWRESRHGQVERVTWACPVDPTNVHPLWEPTLPLWLEALGEQGVPAEGFAITKDAEETFKAYEKDKRRRTGMDEENGERIKLRDE